MQWTADERRETSHYSQQGAPGLVLVSSGHVLLGFVPSGSVLNRNKWQETGDMPNPPDRTSTGAFRSDICVSREMRTLLSVASLRRRCKLATPTGSDDA